MIILAIASVAIVSTGAISATSVFLCRRPVAKPAEPAPPVVFTLTGGSNGQPVEVVTKLNRTVCEFHRSSSYRIVNNLYRLFGSVAIADSEKEVALLYRNTVGNGGYIDFWSHDLQHLSLFRSILWKLQGKDTPDSDSAPLRIYISSKLIAGTYELALDESSTRYLWTAETLELHKVSGSKKQLAARMEKSINGTSTLTIHREVINPYLAVCTCLFFSLEAKDR